VETIFWHITRMPDGHPSIPPRRYPEDIHLAAIMADLEFLMEQVTRLPIRKESAFKPLYVMIGRAGIVSGWFELFWQHCLYDGPMTMLYNPNLKGLCAEIRQLRESVLTSRSSYRLRN
jgi:hypothetical protein